MNSDYEHIIKPTSLLERVLKEEEFCYSNGIFKIQKIEAALKKAEESYLLSINEIHSLFANIISVVNEWKMAALKEFEDAAKLQRHLIIHEKEKLQENLSKLKRIAFISQKELYKCEDPLKKDSIASLCLDELLPTMEPLIPAEGDRDIDAVQFIVNGPFIKQFFHLNTWHKLCYIQHAALDIKSFSLECLEKNYSGRNTAFYIKIPSKCDVVKVAPFITWQVVIANNEPLMTTRSVEGQSIKVEFLISKMDVYTISCFVFNQHISGSPCTIIPLSMKEDSLKTPLSSVKLEDSPFPDKVNDVFGNGAEEISYTFDPCCSSSIISSLSQSLSLPSGSLQSPTQSLSLVPHRLPSTSHSSPSPPHSSPSALHSSPSALHSSPSALHSSPSALHSSPSAVVTLSSASASLISAPPGFPSAPAGILPSVADSLPLTPPNFPSVVDSLMSAPHRFSTASHSFPSAPNTFPSLIHSFSPTFANLMSAPPGFPSAPATSLPSTPATSLPPAPATSLSPAPATSLPPAPATCHPSVPATCHPSVPATCHPSVPATCHPSVPATCHPSAPATVLPSASATGLPSVSASLTTTPHTLPSTSASLLLTPHGFPSTPASLPSAPPGFPSRKPVDRTTKIEKAPLRPPLRRPAATSTELPGEGRESKSTQPLPPRASPSSGKADIEDSLSKFTKMSLEASNCGNSDDSCFPRASTPQKIAVKTELSNGHLWPSTNNFFNNNIGEDDEKPPINTVSSWSCNSSTLTKTDESFTSSKGSDLVKPNLPATITLLQLKLFAKYNLVFTGNAHIQLHQPIGVAQLQNQSLVVADTFANRMLLLSPEGKFLREFNARPPLKQPSAVVVLANGSFAVRDNRCLHLFSPSCQYISAVGDNLLKRPFGLNQDENGFLVTVDTGFGDVLIVVRLNPETGKVVSRIAVENAVSPLHKTMTKPRFIVCKPPSTVLIVDLGLNTVYMVDMETGKMFKKFGKSGNGIGEFNDPSGIICDAEGFIMVGDSRNHRIQIFSPDGDFVCVLPVDRPLKRPSGLCLTPDGQLLVLNYWENSLVRYKLCIKD